MKTVPQWTKPSFFTRFCMTTLSPWVSIRRWPHCSKAQLMQNAPILIFDDSMSAVDTETDAKIRDSLHARHGAGILFLISHRITTLCEADVILVLEHGKLVQMGTHDELMAKKGLYYELYTSQIRELLALD